VIAYGPTNNIQVSDADTETTVLLNDSTEPDTAKPLWKQMIVDGDFAPADSQTKDDAKVWLASKFISDKTVLFQMEDPLTIVDTLPVVLGGWMSDSRGGNLVEDGDSRVFGVIFKWVNPVEIRPPELVLKGYNPAGEERHSLNLFGEAIKTKNDATTSYEFRKAVTANNAPQTFRQWKLEVSVPTLTGTETCTVESLRVSKGFRGAI
jgi:hypothetical protein